MSLSYYIDRHIILKNRGVYFKKGRWIMHVILGLCVLLFNSIDAIGSVKHVTAKQIFVSFLPLLPFWAFFYFYCLYMVPYLFKQNHFKKFWLELALQILILPPIFFLIQMATKSVLPGIVEDYAQHGELYNLGKAYFSFISIFVSFTSMLYFMELLEEVTTVMETDQHKREHYMAALNKIKTQINPVFMSESLDGIMALAQDKNDKAADAVIHFADVLRYRLYKSKSKLVPVEQEITQLQNLFELRNSSPLYLNNCTLEIEGSFSDERMVPMTLISLVEPLMTFGKNDAEWSLLMYLLPDENEIQVAIEINTPESEALENQFMKIRCDLEQLTYDGINFTIEKEPNNYSLRTCIPIFKNSTV